MDKLQQKTTPLVYVPDGAEVNEGNQPLPPPKTEYDERMKVVERDSVKKLVGGQHGAD